MQMRMHAQYAQGLGDAPCPSTEQLLGISDPNDPCQFASAGLPAATPALDATVFGSLTNLAPTPTQATAINPWLLAAALLGVLLVVRG